tara:strand:+ start:1616 stop:1975 length:360 start_codon:yes stop_codon:yes gene_type:complete
MNTSDELIELKLEQLREIGKQHAEAKKNLVYLEHARKILLARLMKEYQLNSTTGKLESAAAQEREARSDTRYEQHIKALSEAVQIEAELNWQKKIVDINFDTWKTKMINDGRERKKYGS